LQTIKPESFTVTEQEIRERFGLSDNDMVIDYGYEKQFNANQILDLQKYYNTSSLFVRTRPDFFITKGKSSYLIEAKQRANTAEAVQLFFNQQLCRMGVNVIYSFPEFNIPAQIMQIQTIYVPEKYHDPFHKFFKDEIRSCIDNVNFISMPNTKGSGDPYVVLDEEYLREFSETAK